MLEVEYTNQMKRDLKLAKKRGKSLSKLGMVVELLQEERSLPERYRNHKLTGEYRDHWECHIEPDWLLIYLLLEKRVLLVRTGSHTDLFE